MRELAQEPQKDLSVGDGSQFISDAESIQPTTECGRLMQELRVILQNGIYIAVSLGYATQTFVVGGFAFYGVEFVQKAYGYDIGKAGIGECHVVL
eukprot:TRINITY_DN10744_c0_g1_i1.p1 TRINITY_DN10744_c0_g1~~TRINITY_DN10744_c0_g1_i1.p1  ORF type:complete len:95 (-),score=15.79 TRINITY_DN10744_c0_g1_i1:49-333(-)